MSLIRFHTRIWCKREPSGVKWTHFSMLSEHSTFILPRNIWPMSGPNVLVWFAVTRVTWSMRVDHPEDDYEVTWDSSSVVLDLRKPLDGSETPLWTKGSPLTTLSPAAPGGHHRRETTRCPRWHNTTTPFIQTRDHKLTKTEQVIKTEEIIISYSWIWSLFVNNCRPSGFVNSF